MQRDAKVKAAGYMNVTPKQITLIHPWKTVQHRNPFPLFGTPLDRVSHSLCRSTGLLSTRACINPILGSLALALVALVALALVPILALDLALALVQTFHLVQA